MAPRKDTRPRKFDPSKPLCSCHRPHMGHHFNHRRLRCKCKVTWFQHQKRPEWCPLYTPR